MKKPIALAIGGLLAVMAGTALYLLPQAAPTQTASGTPDPSAPAVIEESASPLEKPPDAQPATTAKTSSETPRRLETLLLQFNGSRSYRRFVVAALKDASHGGVLYAMEASQQCDTFRRSRDSTGTRSTSNQAMHAAALLDARCDITGDEYFDQLTAAMKAGGVTLDSDPLMAALIPSSRADPREDKLRRARALLDSGDPIAMQSLFALDTQPSRDPPGDTGAYFDGQRYRTEAERFLLMDAWLLAQCSLGVACGPEDTPTLLLCATHDWCGSNVAEALQIGHGRDGSFAQVQALADSLLREIRAKRAAAFVPPAS